MKTLFFLLLTVFFATIGFAEVSQQSDETNKKIEKIEEKLDTTKEELTKYTQITEDTKERVGDISGNVDRFTLILSASIGLFGILITGIVIFFSIRSTREAKLEAKEEAQKEAKRLLQEWIDKEAKSVFEAKVNALSDELQVKGNEILKQIEEKANEQHQRHEEDHQNWMLNINSTQEEKDVIEKEAKQIESKKEEDLTFNDYWVQIINHWNKKENDIALRLIEKTMNLSLNNVEQARLLLAKGATLAQNENFDDAIKIYNEVIDRYKGSSEDDLVAIVVHAMFSKTIALGQQNKHEEVIKISDEIVEKYGNLTAELGAQIFVHKGVALNKLGESDEAIKVYDELIALYKNSKIDRVIIQIAQAMLNKAITLGNQNKPDEAIKTYDELILIYKDAKIEKLIVLVTQAMLNKGAAFNKQNKYDEAINVYNDLISTYKDSKIEGVIEQVVNAMGDKAITFGEMSKVDEELKVYDELISIYKNSKINSVLKEVFQTMLNKGATLSQLKRHEEAIKAYDEAIALYRNSKVDGSEEQVIGGIVNKLELEIILDKSISTDRTLIEKLTQSPKDIAIIDMLFILQNAKESSQDVELQAWLEKYKDVKHSGWDFDVLEKWIGNVNYSDEIKVRIQSYVEIFKTQLHRA